MVHYSSCYQEYTCEIRYIYDSIIFHNINEPMRAIIHFNDELFCFILGCVKYRDNVTFYLALPWFILRNQDIFQFSFNHYIL
jgi:hypothetical protein